MNVENSIKCHKNMYCFQENKNKILRQNLQAMTKKYTKLNEHPVVSIFIYLLDKLHKYLA